MDKQNVVYTHNGMLFSSLKKDILTHATIWINLENATISKQASHKRSNTL